MQTQVREATAVAAPGEGSARPAAPNGAHATTTGAQTPARAEVTAVDPPDVAAGEGCPRARRWLVAATALFIAALAALGAASWLRARLQPPIGTGLLFASGRIEGRITTLTPKTAAWVVSLHVDEGEPVNAGQLLATLDDRAQRERVRSAEQQLRAIAQRLRASDRQIAMTAQQTGLEIERAEAAVREAEVRLRRAQASREQAERDAARATMLVARELIAPQVAEHARLNADVEVHAVRAAEEALSTSQKQLALARVGPQQVDVQRAERDALEQQRQQAQAQLGEQQSHVIDFAIRSPIAGRVLTRTVERGERVEAGTPLFTLVDLDRLYVKIYVPEPSIGKIALGQEARIHVDAYPDRPFPARVTRVAEEAEFTPKNVETREERVKLVFAVEVALLDNRDGLLKPGMPADTAIRLRPDAPWAVPHAGSRFTLWPRRRGDAR